MLGSKHSRNLDFNPGLFTATGIKYLQIESE